MKKDNAYKRNGKLSIVLYAVAAVLAVIFVYMLIVNIMYISSYTVSYGMTFSDMWQEAVQYIVTGSVSYFVYAVLVFAAGKIIDKLNEPGIVEKQPEIYEHEDDMPDIQTGLVKQRKKRRY